MKFLIFLFILKILLINIVTEKYEIYDIIEQPEPLMVTLNLNPVEKDKISISEYTIYNDVIDKKDEKSEAQIKETPFNYSKKQGCQKELRLNIYKPPQKSTFGGLIKSSKSNKNTPDKLRRNSIKNSEPTNSKGGYSQEKNQIYNRPKPRADLFNTNSPSITPRSNDSEGFVDIYDKGEITTTNQKSFIQITDCKGDRPVVKHLIYFPNILMMRFPYLTKTKPSSDCIKQYLKIEILEEDKLKDQKNMLYYRIILMLNHGQATALHGIVKHFMEEKYPKDVKEDLMQYKLE
jgi:hypothetical protein